MARKSNLNLAYAAMHALLERGEALDPTAVARESGLTRGTLYQKDDDWTAVMKMIEGARPIPVAVAAEKKIAPTATRRYQQLASRVALMEARLEKLEELANNSQQKLLAQLHHFFQKGAIAPSKREELIRARNQAGFYEQKARKLAIENERLNDQSAVARVVQLRGSKRIVIVPSLLSPIDALEHFVATFRANVPDLQSPSVVTSVTLVCGLPMSGKSKWTAMQAPSAVGVSVYVEGCFHTPELRAAVKRHLLERGSMKVGCAWVNTEVNTCLERAYLSSDDDAVADAIERMHREQTVVSVAEPFDFIFGVFGE